MFIKQPDKDYILVAVSMDDFSAAPSNPALNDAFHHSLDNKFIVERLGQASSYLNWSIKYADDRLHVSQQHHIQQVAQYLLDHGRRHPINDIVVRRRQYRSTQAIRKRRSRHGRTIPCRARRKRLFRRLHQTRYRLCSSGHGTGHPETNAAALAVHEPHGPLPSSHVFARFAIPKSHKHNDHRSILRCPLCKRLRHKKSFSGNLYSIDGANINWRVKQQPVVAQSTFEADISATETAKGTTLLRSLLPELGFLQKSPPT